MKADSSSEERGRLLARVLSGAWRSDPFPSAISASDLARVSPILLRTGAGSLAWWQTSQGGKKPGGSSIFFQQAHELHTLQARTHEDRLTCLLRQMHASGVDPILNKGWSVARHYPSMALRPYGDIDLCVQPKQMGLAIQVLNAMGENQYCVDLHQGMPDLVGRSWSELWARSVLVPLGELSVRCLGAEDQFRLLCLHLVRHGGWRPLWLCDIAALLESLPPRFDWKVCLAGPRWLSDWVLCVAGLATEFLGACWDAKSIELAPVPKWIALSILRQWSSEVAGDSHTRDCRPIASYLRSPSGLLAALRHRWPNPVEATVRMRRSPQTILPSFLLQTGAWLERGLGFAWRSLSLKGRRNRQVNNTYQVHPVA